MKQCTCYALRAIDCTCKPAKYGELYTSPTAKQEQDGSLINEGTKTKQEPVAWYHAEDFKTNFTTEPSEDLVKSGYWQPLYKKAAL
jgi:hypothetical protein